jgi:hypothetical protein
MFPLLLSATTLSAHPKYIGGISFSIRQPAIAALEYVLPPRLNKGAAPDSHSLATRLRAMILFEKKNGDPPVL